MGKELPKKLLKLFLFCMTLTVIFTFLPTKELISNLPYIRELYSNTSLTITLTNGKANIQIDGEEYGETNQVINELPEGSYSVTLDRIAEDDCFYTAQTFPVDITKNTESIIDMEIGPASIKSGYILSYSQFADIKDAKGNLSIMTKPENATISLNNKFIQESPLSAHTLDASSYKLVVEKTGYESIQLPIVVRKGYNLNVTIYLMPIPTQLTQ